MFATVSNRSIGEIKFDAVTSEDHTSELSITENPIESGAAVADHAVVQPKSVTIVGTMVDHSHSASLFESLNIPYIRGVTDFLNKLPFPVSVATQTVQTIAKAERLFSQAQGAIAMAGEVLDAARPIAPWLPDFGLGGLLDSVGDDGRVKKCYADLVAAQKTGQTINVQTGIHLYENMLIQSIGVAQSQDGSATFTITCREIFIVETQAVKKAGNFANATKTTSAGKSKSGRAATQSAAKSQKGNVAVKNEPPKRTSFLNKIFG